MIFLSYSTKDSGFVNRLEQDLFLAGIQVGWRDCRRVDIGQSLPRRIQEGIASSEYVISVLSPSYVESPWCNQELMAAWSLESVGKRCRILPVMAGTCQPPFLILGRLYANMVGNAYGEGLGHLVKALKSPVETLDMVGWTPKRLPQVGDSRLLVDRVFEVQPFRLLLRAGLRAQRQPTAVFVRGFAEDMHDKFVKRLSNYDAEVVLSECCSAGGASKSVSVWWPNGRAHKCKSLDQLAKEFDVHFSDALGTSGASDRDFEEAVRLYTLVLGRLEVDLRWWDATHAKLLRRLLDTWSRLPSGPDRPLCLLTINVEVAGERPRWDLFRASENLPADLCNIPFEYGDLFPIKVPIDLRLVDAFFVRKWLDEIDKDPTEELSRMIDREDSWPMRRVQNCLKQIPI